jgi:hypothetical protein
MEALGAILGIQASTINDARHTLPKHYINTDFDICVKQAFQQLLSELSFRTFTIQIGQQHCNNDVPE